MQSTPDGCKFSFEKDLANTQPLTASSQTRLAKVMELMAANPEASCILAVYRQKVIGIATRSDLMRAIAAQADWPKLRLSKVIMRPVMTVSATEPKTLTSLLQQLEQHRISHLPVVDGQGNLLGLIEQNRLMQKLLHQHQQYRSPLQHQRTQQLAEITLKIRQSLHLKDILQTTVDEVKRLLDADRVLIYQIFPDGTGKTTREAVASPYASILDIAFPEEVFPEDYQALYAKGRVRPVADVHQLESGLSDCLVEFMDELQVQSKLIVPIVQPMNPSVGETSLSKQLWGLLIAHHCRNPRQWSDFELDLMQHLAGQISLALSQGQLLEYLEDRVELRTAELTESNLALQREIKERQLVEAALRQSEAQLRLITNNLPVLIAYVDSNQCYQFNNQVYEHWLGESPQTISGKSMKRVMGKAHYEKVKDHIVAALAGEAVSYESELTFQGGRSHSVSVTYIPHIEPHSRPHKEVSKKNNRNSKRKSKPQVKGFFALTTDISDRIAIERMKDEFIAVVSHELRTPLKSLHTSHKL